MENTSEVVIDMPPVSQPSNWYSELLSLKTEIAALQHRISVLESIQSDPVFLVKNYGPKSHALFNVSAKLAKELASYSVYRRYKLFSPNPGLTFRGVKTSGWVITHLPAYDEVVNLLHSLKVPCTMVSPSTILPAFQGTSLI